MANSMAGILFGPLGKAVADTLGKNNAPSLPPPPAFTPDPNYTAQMNFLQPYSMGLLSGNNIPAYYQSIGEQNSPEFQSALAVGNKQIGTSAAEGAAMAGTGRGGQLPQVVSQAVGDNTAALTYQDFLNSNQGKQFLMGAGENTSQQVLTGALTNQSQENNYNLDAYNAQYGANGTARYNIGESQAAAGATGQMLGSIAGTVLGLPAGPAGATIGSQVGGQLGSSLSNLFGLSGTNSGSASSTPAQASGGVSSIGSISNMNTDDLMQYFNLQ